MDSLLTKNTLAEGEGAVRHQLLLTPTSVPGLGPAASGSILPDLRPRDDLAGAVRQLSCLAWNLFCRAG
jgi:hypothetical protein